MSRLPIKTATNCFKLTRTFRFIGEFIVQVSLCRPSVGCCQHFQTSFSSEATETTRPIEVKFPEEPPWDGVTKVCSNEPGARFTKLFMTELIHKT